MSKSLDRCEAAVGSACIGLSGMALAGLVLAEAGRFAAWPVAGLGAAIAAGGFLWIRRALQRHGVTVVATPWRDWLVVAALMAASAWLFLPPAEAFIDGGDASVYLADARLVASSGGLAQTDSLLSSIPSDLWPELFAESANPPKRLMYFPGDLLIDSGKVVPSFFHLVPILMATADVWMGSAAALWVNPIAGLLGVLLVWAIARRLSGSFGGAVAASLLAACFAQIWFARYPTSEVVTQVFVLFAVLSIVAATDLAVPALAALAGVSLGLAGFCRVDALVIAALPAMACAAGAAILARSSRRVWIGFLIGGGLALVYAFAHAWIWAGLYTERIVGMMFVGRWRNAGSVPLAMAVAGLFIALWALRTAFRHEPWSGVRRASPAVMAVAGASLIALNAGRLAVSPFMILVGPALAIAMVVGLLALVSSRRATAAFPVAALFLVSATIYLQSAREPNGLPTALRRFVPVLLPLGMVLAGAGLALVARRGRAWRAAAVAVAVAFAAQFIVADRPLLASVPYQGVRAAMSELSALVPADAVTFVDGRVMSHVALALRYESDRRTVLVAGPHEPGSLVRAVGAMIARGRRVRLIVPRDGARTPGGLSPDEIRALAIRGVGSVTLRVPQFPAMPDRLPSAVVTPAATLDVYDVTTSQPGPLPLQIDVGDRDFGSILGGFHGAEVIEQQTVRWTDGDGRIAVPPLAVADEDGLDLVLRFECGRPCGVVSVELDDRAVGVVTPATSGFGEYRIALGPEAIRAVRWGSTLRLRSDTFVPGDNGRSTDRRHLGVALDWLEFQPACEETVPLAVEQRHKPVVHMQLHVAMKQR